MADIADRIRGALLGAAIGDALGAPFEFVSSAAIEAQLGRPRVLNYHEGTAESLLPGYQKGMPTDDTAMSLALAGVLADAEAVTAQRIARAFVNDLAKDGKYGELFWKGAFGNATMRALRRLRAGADPETNGYPEDGGNGTAMRAHVVGVLPDRGQVAEVAAIQARVTHGHPAAIAAAQAVALVVHDAIHGRQGSLKAAPPAGVDETILLKAWKAAHRDLNCDSAGRLPAHLRDVHMSAWETVAAAHAIALVFADDPEQGIAAAAASGGDTDTVACIAGAMLGASRGASALPPRWIKGLCRRVDAEQAAEALIDRYYEVAVS